MKFMCYLPHLSVLITFLAVLSRNPFEADW